MRMVSQRKVAPLLDIDDLLARFRNREASVGVIGLGYVGLPLSLAACAAGFRVRGFDINQERVEGLNGGGSRSGERRGGEEGRSRWWPDHLKKKKKKKHEISDCDTKRT